MNLTSPCTSLCNSLCTSAEAVCSFLAVWLCPANSMHYPSSVCLLPLLSLSCASEGLLLPKKFDLFSVICYRDHCQPDPYVSLSCIRGFRGPMCWMLVTACRGFRGPICWALMPACPSATPLLHHALSGVRCEQSSYAVQPAATCRHVLP